MSRWELLSAGQPVNVHGSPFFWLGKTGMCVTCQLLPLDPVTARANNSSRCTECESLLLPPPAQLYWLPLPTDWLLLPLLVSNRPFVLVSWSQHISNVCLTRANVRWNLSMRRITNQNVHLSVQCKAFWVKSLPTTLNLFLLLCSFIREKSNLSERCPHKHSCPQDGRYKHYEHAIL